MQSKYIFYLQNGITSFEITLPRGVAKTSTTTSKGTSAIPLPVQSPVGCPDQSHTSWVCPQQIWNLWCLPQPACVSSKATLIQNNFNNFRAKQQNMWQQGRGSGSDHSFVEKQKLRTSNMLPNVYSVNSTKTTISQYFLSPPNTNIVSSKRHSRRKIRSAQQITSSSSSTKSTQIKHLFFNPCPWYSCDCLQDSSTYAS